MSWIVKSWAKYPCYKNLTISLSLRQYQQFLSQIHPTSKFSQSLMQIVLKPWNLVQKLDQNLRLGPIKKDHLPLCFDVFILP